MERIIATFTCNQNYTDDKNIGEIIIDDNRAEFYVIGALSHFADYYMGSDNRYSYTVYVDGPEYKGTNNMLDYSSCYRVICVIKSAQYYRQSINEKNIRRASFTFPELRLWLNRQTLACKQVSINEYLIMEKSIDDIVLLNKDELDIRITYDTENYENANKSEKTQVLKLKRILRF